MKKEKPKNKTRTKTEITVLIAVTLIAVVIAVVSTYNRQDGELGNQETDNIQCAEFEDDIVWSSGYSREVEGSTHYQTWTPSAPCRTGDSKCFLKNIDVKTRAIYLPPYKTNTNGQGYFQIAEPDNAVCDNPDAGVYSRYLAQEKTNVTENEVIDWSCNRPNNFTNTCNAEIVYAGCYGIKAHSSQYFLIDALAVKYQLCSTQGGAGV